MRTHGIYIHIPFCRKKCDYCGFYSIPVRAYHPDSVVPDAFVDKCINECEERLNGRNITADTIYFGGGTPSMLSIEQIRGIVASIRRNVRVEKGSEITVEMNPEDVSGEKLEGYADAGASRIVLGVQTMSERLLALIGRTAHVCTQGMLDVFFNAGGIQHSVDVIMGIPSQKKEELLLDLDTVAGYRPDHVSAYLLSIEKNTPLGMRMKIDPADEDGQAGLYELTAARLAHHGYDQYEISNFALPGGRSRHNMKYWRFEPYYGLGPGAHSFIDNERYYNAMSVDEYINAPCAVLRKDVRKPESAAVEYILTGLRVMSGFSVTDMERRLNFHLPESVMSRIMKARSEGMIIMDEEDRVVNLRLSPRGIILADTVIYSIVEPLL